MEVDFLSAYFGNKQPSNTGIIQIDGISFYDIRVISDVIYSITVDISITNQLFNSQSIVSYWNDEEWIIVESEFEEPDTLKISFNGSKLSGTSIMISGNSPSPQPESDLDPEQENNNILPLEINSIVITGLLFLVVMIIITLILVRLRNRKKEQNSH